MPGLEKLCLANGLPTADGLATGVLPTPSAICLSVVLSPRGGTPGTGCPARTVRGQSRLPGTGPGSHLQAKAVDAWTGPAPGPGDPAVVVRRRRSRFPPWTALRPSGATLSKRVAQWDIVNGAGCLGDDPFIGVVEKYAHLRSL